MAGAVRAARGVWAAEQAGLLERYPALASGLHIVEKQGKESAAEILARISECAASSGTCDLPPAVTTGSDVARETVIEVTAGQARAAVAHAMLGNGTDVVTNKPASRCSGDGHGGGMDLSTWLTSGESIAAEKAACVLHYLAQATSPSFDTDRRIRFKLRAAGDISKEMAGGKRFPEVRVHVGEFTERPGDSTFVNFGNAVYLYGIITASASGVTVEEFLQAEHPELMVGMLYFGQLAPEEAVIVEGVRKFATHTGYMASFKCAGSCEDKRDFTVLTMDAKNYNHDLERPRDDPEYKQEVSYADQFAEPGVRRDVRKAFAAFAGQKAVSTGKWGCGVFKGNVYLKLLQQTLAASMAGCQELSFTTYRQEAEAENCRKLMEAVQKTSPDALWSFLFSLPVEEIAKGGADDAAFLAAALKQF
eukprot:TRINITY_DN2792_c0_g2_i1.p1 TRINITY_DN2792_c0_g2~~TRINITY_DN2792_c0_g2_i1.p1  ORF type:complete len:420 (+),score=136.90 TRINITY_DN2792_c0_g2_i1:803-2062(+)